MAMSGVYDLDTSVVRFDSNLILRKFENIKKG